VTYSGLIVFLSGLVSVSFGLIFTLIVTRRLSPEEYGTWGLLFSIVSYFLISEFIFSFWATRQIARGEIIGKTSFFSSSLLSISLFPIFVVYVFLVSENSEANFEILLLGFILIPVSILSLSLTAINLGHKPHATGYSQIIYQIIKILVVFTTVVIFDLDVFGIVLAVLFAFLGKIGIQLYYARSKLKDRFDYQKLKRWIKTSWIPLFLSLQNYLITIDIALYSIITGSVIGIAYYTVAFSIAAIVQHAGNLSQALYPKLLADKNFEGIKMNINHVLYFSILLIGISIIFSEPALFALNPLYQNAWPIVIVLSFRVFLQALRTIPEKIIAGTEQVDTENNPTFSKLIKSNLFKLPKFLSIFNTCYIIVLIAFLFLFSNLISELDLVFWWAMIGLIIEIPTSIFLWMYSAKLVKLSFPIVNSFKYMLGMFGLVIFFVLTSDLVLNYEPSIYDFFPSLLLEIALCVSIYLGLTYLLDKNTRNLFKSILNEIKT